MTAPDLNIGDLVQAVVVARVSQNRDGVVHLRLLAGAVVPLRIDQPGVTFTAVTGIPIPPPVAAPELPERPSWADPNHELTHYDQLGLPEAQLDYPGMCYGTYTYASLNTWENR